MFVLTIKKIIEKNRQYIADRKDIIIYGITALST